MVAIALVYVQETYFPRERHLMLMLMLRNIRVLDEECRVLQFRVPGAPGRASLMLWGQDSLELNDVSQSEG